MLIITPFMLVTGLFKGPGYVFRRAVARRRLLLSMED
jgi:hypothetical protein